MTVTTNLERAGATLRRRKVGMASAVGRVARYASDVINLHDTLRYSRLIEYMSNSGAPYLARRHGTTTIGATTVDFPHRYLMGLAGFRLAQYLQIGYASPDITFARTLFTEPVRSFHPDDWHILTIDDDSGRILAYVELAAHSDHQPRPVLNHRERKLFPVEQAHSLNLFEAVGAPENLLTSEVREIKRFVHNHSYTDKMRKLQVSLDLLLAVARMIEAAYPRTRALVGDAEAHVALRHLLLMGLQVRVVSGTRPALPEDHLLHPVYSVREVVEPFYAEVPGMEEITRVVGIVESATATDNISGAITTLMRETRGNIRRLVVDGGKPAGVAASALA